ncbi:hypothetical protein H4R33_004666 [Dimargaris cristalligena]|uniref:Flavin reductase like domain-containing protein n=1 Tax=Dimargaris cristalligena TaxID=215637 RepID=A0A4P9ZUX3_9FUNG|nr:hypothetical protein H4R33_004666 [Dimargaris cristalligena]RKP37406.1 flavin reductase like domain-containing protein [Dimargaris cristalligena]|eukprot:RKP37406.1 flavin reductase like domain-containing protein [Dimargaris cristalligena]
MQVGTAVECNNLIFAEGVRKVLRTIATPVVVLTTYDPEHERSVGMTVGSFSSVSLRPPIVSFNIRNPSRFGEALHRSRRVVINILAGDQTALSAMFADPHQQYRPDHSPFRDIPHTLLTEMKEQYTFTATTTTTSTTTTSTSTTTFANATIAQLHPIPVLKGTVGGLEGSVREIVPMGDHEVWFFNVQQCWDHSASLNRPSAETEAAASYRNDGPTDSPVTEHTLHTPSNATYPPSALLYCNRRYHALDSHSELGRPLSGKS